MEHLAKDISFLLASFSRVHVAVSNVIVKDFKYIAMQVPCMDDNYNVQTMGKAKGT